jgi:signal transduction histidine kinase
MYLVHRVLKKFRESLRIRILFFFLVVGLFPFILVSVTFLSLTKKTLIEATYNNLQVVAENRAKEITPLISRAQAGIKVLSNSLILASLTASQLEKIEEMYRIQRSYKLYNQIALANTEGLVVASTGSNRLESWSNQDWFREARNRKILVSDLYFFNPSQATLVFAAPVLDSEGGVVYVVAGYVGLERIWEITDKFKIGKFGYVTLVDHAGRVLAHPDKEMVLKPFNSQKLLAKILRGDISAGSYTLSDGTEIIAAYTLLPSEVDYFPPKWHMIAVEPEKEALAPVEAVQRWIWITLELGCALAVILGLKATQSILGPLQILIVGAQKIVKGNVKSRIKIKSQDEWGVLGQALNQIAETLEEQIQISRRPLDTRTLELEIKAVDRAQKLATVSNISQLISSTLNMEEVLQMAVAIVGRSLNASQCSMLLIEKDGLHLRSKYQYYANTSQTELIDVRISLDRYPELKKAIRTQRPVVVNDVQMDPLMYELRDTLARLGIRSILVLPLMIEGKLLGLLVLRWREKATLLKLEEIRLGEIIASQISIALKNAELFAEERRLEQMKNEFARMGIRNILEIYKMEEGTLKLQEKTIPLDQLMKAAVKQFELLARQEAIDLIVEIPENPLWIQVDDQLFLQVLINILHNGIKYTPRGGKVTLGAEKRENGEVCIKVQDTGVGIPREYLSRIFDKFVQVETQKREGDVSIGLGLYFCKLTMEAHGGRIWAESQEGKGSIFYLIIPPDRVIEA